MTDLWTPERDLELPPRFEPWTLEGLSPSEMDRIMRGVSGGFEGYNALVGPPFLGPLTFNTFTGPQDVTSNTTQEPVQMAAGWWARRAQAVHTLAAGTFSTTVAPTLAFGTYAGTTALAVSAAFTTTSGAVTLPWCLETWTTLEGTGTAGLMKTRGNLIFGTSLTAISNVPVPATAWGVNVTVDTTVLIVWAVKATYSVSNASNIVVTHQYIVESYN